MTKEQVAYNGLEMIEKQIKEGYINIISGSVKATTYVRLKHARNAIQDLTNENDKLENLVAELSERVAIMQEGRDGWHFSGTPEIPAGRNQVTVIVWANNGQVYPLNYCRTTIRGKETYRYEWMYWRVYGMDDTIKAWRYLPKAPEGVEG